MVVFLRKMNPEDSWSRCAKEFPTAAANDRQEQRPVYVKRLDFSSETTCRGFQATDIDLADLEQIKSADLVANWIAQSMCTQSFSHHNESCPLSPRTDGSLAKKQRHLSPPRNLDKAGSIPLVLQDLEKSPVFGRPKLGKDRNESVEEVAPTLTKSPIIGRNILRGRCKRRFGSQDTVRLEKSSSIYFSPATSIPCSQTSPKPAAARKKLAQIKCKRLLNPLQLAQKSSPQSDIKEDEIAKITRVPDTGNMDYNVAEPVLVKMSNIQSNQDVFADVINAGSLMNSRERKEEKNLLFFYKDRIDQLSIEVVSKESRINRPGSSRSSVNRDKSDLSPFLLESVITRRESNLRRLGENEDSAKASASRGQQDLAKRDSMGSSQDLFGDELITGSPRPVERVSIKCEDPEMLTPKIEQSEPDIRFNYSPSTPGINNAPYCSPPSTVSFVKAEPNCDEQFIGNIIEDTEKSHVIHHRSARDAEFSILDSLFKVERQPLSTDTQHIDYDTNSEKDEDEHDILNKNVVNTLDSDSDKTVSDFIEEPSTQNCLQPLQSAPISNCQSGLLSLISASPKISETISEKELPSSPKSVIDMSMETTPPRTQEHAEPLLQLLSSGKKRKIKPKKGSLGARLQKLISGQVSSVRLWRHQMSREAGFKRSSAPCTTLQVLQTWTHNGKNFYHSKVLDDAYSLLSSCFDHSLTISEESHEENQSRSLVVMTNPDFVGSITMFNGAVFKIYMPWEILNRNSMRGHPILSTMYFNVVSNPIGIKEEPNSADTRAEKSVNSTVRTMVIHEYDCPCLRKGEIDESCLTKFTNQKIDIIGEILKQ